jgi:hypothetical protein
MNLEADFVHGYREFALVNDLNCEPGFCRHDGAKRVRDFRSNTKANAVVAKRAPFGSDSENQSGCRNEECRDGFGAQTVGDWSKSR